MKKPTAVVLASPKFPDADAVKRILELRGWGVTEKKPDFVITVGGDGSVLYAEAKYPGVPIIAFKAGALGFLACNEVEEIEEVLKAVEKGKYSIDSREKLEFSVPGKRELALNEVLITSSLAGKALRLEILVDSQRLGYFVCDGVLAATPTGSTGYNLSCGGPVIEPASGSYALTLINPHLSKLRSLVLSKSRVVEVRFTRSNPGITVVADGLKSVKIGHNDVVVIKNSGKQARLVRTENDYFPSLEGLFT